MTLKQHWSRVKNVHGHLISTGKKGRRLRKQFYELTGNKKYLEKNYIKASLKGKGYKVSETRKVVSRVEKIKELKLKHRWVKAGKPMTWKKFRKLNKHTFEYEIDDIELYYDSP